jgi:hypothetical protein
LVFLGFVGGFVAGGDGGASDLFPPLSITYKESVKFVYERVQNTLLYILIWPKEALIGLKYLF